MLVMTALSSPLLLVHSSGGVVRVGAVTHYEAEVWGGRVTKCGQVYEEKTGDWMAVDIDLLGDVQCGQIVTLCGNGTCLDLPVLDTGGPWEKYYVQGTGPVIADLPTHTMAKFVGPKIEHPCVSFLGSWRTQ